MNHPIIELLSRALDARAGLFDERHETAFRLFNGFTEGQPQLAVDLYARTLVLHDYSETSEQERGQGQQGLSIVAAAEQFYQSRLPWISAALLKSRQSANPEDRAGRLVTGSSPTHKVRENGVWYAVDLTMNRDAGLYLDTRNLRAWELRNLAGARVLNTFAYTGSLGVAAKAAGASRVVHLDLNRTFLNVAKTSYTLNGFPIVKSDFLTGDFWSRIGGLIRNRELFDCVLLDPPFFAATKKGVVDMEKNYARLINKVRPLIAHGGTLIAVNNAVYVSGAEYLKTLEALCEDGYLTIEELIPVAEDFAGYPTTRVEPEMIDPAPFNHSTKIAILRVLRKDAKTTSTPS